MKKLFTIAIIAIATLFITTAAKADVKTATFVELDSNPGLNWVKNVCITESAVQGNSGAFVFSYVIKSGGCAAGSTNTTAQSGRMNDGSLVILVWNRFFADHRSEDKERAFNACVTRVENYNQQTALGTLDTNIAAQSAEDECEEEGEKRNLPVLRTLYRLVTNKDTGGAAPSSKDDDEKDLATYGYNTYIKKCDRKGRQTDFVPINAQGVCQTNPNFNPYQQ